MFIMFSNRPSSKKAIKDNIIPTKIINDGTINCHFLSNLLTNLLCATKIKNAGMNVITNSHIASGMCLANENADITKIISETDHIADNL